VTAGFCFEVIMMGSNENEQADASVDAEGTSRKWRMSYGYPSGPRGAITYSSWQEAQVHADRVRRVGGTAEMHKVGSAA
jgi:hypothetical protein